MNCKKIGIIGLGLIGGSIALALSDRYRVLGFDTDKDTCEYAAKNGFCTVVKDRSEFSECFVVFVCTPIRDTAAALEEIIETVGNKVIVTDVASVKTVFRSVGGRYVGGHPMAGTERGGIRAAKPHLFQNAYWAVTGEGEDAEAVCGLVRETGAIPVRMSAEDHDAAVSCFSHTPHAVAYALVSAALKNNVSPIAGSGFMDTTRIAKSDGRFWTDVFGANTQNVLNGIDSVKNELDTLYSLISAGDAEALNAYLTAARQKRLALEKIDLGGEALYVDLVDRVGEFERVTSAIAAAGINLTNMALVPARDGVGGALRLEFACSADRLAAQKALGITEQNDEDKK